MGQKVRAKIRDEPKSATVAKSASKPAEESKTQPPAKKKEGGWLAVLMAILILSATVFFKGRPTVSSVPQSLQAGKSAPLQFEEPLQFEVGPPVPPAQPIPVNPPPNPIPIPVPPYCGCVY